jgi:protein-disulfide isomerase
MRIASLSPYVLAALASLGCAKKQTVPSPSTAAASASPVDVSLAPETKVAQVNGEAILARDLDAKIADELGGMQSEFVTKVHDLRKSALEEIVAERLLKAESAARKLPDEKALVKEEVESKVTQPTDAELQALFEKHVKPSYPGVTFDMAKPTLVQQATQEAMRTRFMAYLGELKVKYGVKTTLPGPILPRVEVEAVGPSKGPQTAKVTIVEFSDFECPFCSRAAETVKQVEQAYGDKIRLVFRHYPLPFHQQAPKAAEAAACAADQGRFWEMHDTMFGHQDQLATEGLKSLARMAGLDGAKFDACLDGGAKAEAVKKDMEAGKEAKVNGTPAFFINGRVLSGAQPFEAFKEVIDAELAN